VIAANKAANLQARLLGVVCLKNMVERHWRREYVYFITNQSCSSANSSTIREEEKGQVRAGLLKMFNEENIQVD